jgi:threo-3-hydroxy-L-aspartate ammonia-lyase
MSSEDTDRRVRWFPVLGIADVREAMARLNGLALRTPLQRSVELRWVSGSHVFLKCEMFQRTGTFKFRGAYNRISTLSRVRRRRGVVAFSSGNHAQAVGLAASLAGTSAVIVMPKDAPPEKVEATREYGVEVVPYDRYREDREEIARGLAEERGLTLVPPYDDPMVMAGQGTAALEVLEDLPNLAMLVVPIGGGGLMAGSATVAKALVPSIRVIGVEPVAGDDTRRSLKSGRRVQIDVPRTIADGLQAAVPGEQTFEVNRRLVDDVVTVTDEEILSAMRFLFERMKLVVEPSGAVGVAALMARRIPRVEDVGVILSGGNISAKRFAGLFSSVPPSGSLPGPPPSR